MEILDYTMRCILPTVLRRFGTAICISELRKPRRGRGVVTPLAKHNIIWTEMILRSLTEFIDNKSWGKTKIQ